jgi:hypothetical protein
MNEKTPEVAERSSKRKCLRMGRSSKRVARRPGAEMMWPSGGGSRTCNPGSNLGTVAVALGPTMARSVKARTACEMHGNAFDAAVHCSGGGAHTTRFSFLELHV